MRQGSSCHCLALKFNIYRKPATWWLIPLSKWVMILVIGGLNLLIPLIAGVIIHLLTGVSHQVLWLRDKPNIFFSRWCRHDPFKMLSSLFFHCSGTDHMAGSTYGCWLWFHVVFLRWMAQSWENRTTMASSGNKSVNPRPRFPHFHIRKYLLPISTWELWSMRPCNAALCWWSWMITHWPT